MEELDEVENLEIEVHGCIEIIFDKQSFGFCPIEQIPLEGADLLSTWFEQLTEACLLLKNHNIVLINDISSYNNMFRFRKIENEIIVIDQLYSEKKEGSISTKDIDATYGIS